MEHFVTLFNATYIPQGLALLASMNRNIEQFKLWVLCIDDDTYEFFATKNFANVGLIKLSDVITEELLAAKKTRSIAEFCWTLTPFSIQYVFDADSSVSRATYLDADLWFRKNPEKIFEELNASGKNILITDHAYAPEYDQSETSGKFCVQFMTFSREDPEGVNHWWGQRCLEWCYARAEDGKFGDQKYLDDWPVRFETKVHVLINKELILAPWNASRFPYGNSAIWHFQGLRLTEDEQYFSVHLSEYALPETTLNYVYQAYVMDLKQVVGILIRQGVKISSQTKKLTWISRIRYKLSPWYTAFKKINRPAAIKITH